MKKIYQPVTPFHINQKFGENKACVSLDGKHTFITCNGLNPPKGFKSVYGANGHLGLDLRAGHGQEVYCALSGFVYFIDTHARSGLDVRVESMLGGRKIRHIYEHLMGYQPKKGDYVFTGELIGWANNTGWSSGDHLHFQVEEFIDGKWIPIDPLSLMEPTFARKILLQKSLIKYMKEVVALLSDRLADLLRKKRS